MEFPAHISSNEDGSRSVQTCQEHCRGAAKYAGKALSSADLYEAAYLSALVHDLGKFKEEFSIYLQDENAVKGSVNHSFAGCRLLLELFHGDNGLREEDLTAELLAYAVGAHHGLFDCVDENQKSGFLHRMNTKGIGYEEATGHFLNLCVSRDELSERFCAAHKELMTKYRRIMEISKDNEETCFYFGLLGRLLLSAVIEGDRRDTREFMSGSIGKKECDPVDLHLFWEKYLCRVEEKIQRFSCDSPIDRARRSISDICRGFAEREGGIYRLNVPTGGGKTLSSLRYALAHGMNRGKTRIIFTSPLLSILEQNAKVIRDFLEDDSIILEHHSNVIRPKDGEDLDLLELATENWDSPVIITTLVQLLNTMFLGKTTAVRRFHALCNSIIVIDEVQTVPNHMLSMFELTVNFLAEICGATVILCSATQPSFAKTDHALRVSGDIVPYDPLLWGPFLRTRICDAGEKTLEEIADFARNVMETANSLLVVCNKRDEAAYLFRELRDSAEVCLHLSASMCTQHRRDCIEKLFKALHEGRRCICVSTQVIEAGVDVSFQQVIRLSAGMDSVIQAAGRCNRNGESSEPQPVYVVNCQGENLTRLREIHDGKESTKSLLYAFRNCPERFQADLSSQSAIDCYYENRFRSMPVGYRDYCIKPKDLFLLDLLSKNEKYLSGNLLGKFYLNQAFATAGKLFRVFDQETWDVVVPYGEGAVLIRELLSKKSPTVAYLHQWVCRAKAYTIGIYDYQKKKLADGMVEYCGITILQPVHYSEDLGLAMEAEKLEFMEV